MTQRDVNPHPAWLGASFAAVLACLAIAVAGCGSSKGASSSTAAAQAVGSTASAKSTSTPASSTAASPTDSTSTTAPGKPAQKPALILEAEPICKQLNAKLLASPGPKASKTEQVRNIVHNAVLEHEALGKLEKLSAPPSLVATWGQVLEIRKALAGELLAIAGYVQSGNQKQLKASSVSKYRKHERLAEVAKGAGFDECSHVGPVLPGKSGAGAAKTHTAALHNGR